MATMPPTALVAKLVALLLILDVLVLVLAGPTAPTATPGDDGGAARTTTTTSTAVVPDSPAPQEGPAQGPGEGKFLYFAYGSNLLARRLLIMNPTAQRYAVGRLKDYRLDFSTPPSKRWGGAPATVVPDPGEDVWGAVWSLDVQDRDNLDAQEGVGTGWYDMFNATVLTPGGAPLPCRCYMMRVVPPKVGAGEARPAERQPSLVYKQVMLVGARESGLPERYVARLAAVPDNGSLGVDPPVTLESLGALGAASAASNNNKEEAPAAL